MSTEIPILAIDAGNTRIKWGLHEGGHWRARGVLPTADAPNIGLQWIAAPTGTSAVASNVAGPAVAEHLANAAAERGIDLQIIVTPASQLGVTNGYRNPGQLGTDRWAALVAAHRAMPGDKLVVNVGTALTIDALAGDGRFLGGLIVPGPALMRRSLDHGTAALRLVDGMFEPFPSSTPNAITTGAIQACVGAIERVRGDMVAQGVPPMGLLLSGGGALEIAAHLPMPATFNENLVLDGLVAMALPR
ncbi:Type III pantothenate kinase [Usitatibacter rugosus]|uniref:Type III pantothenate kinase n=1 Tax=Usitatibacter rugosus TaxID=2732067 RepID=A0A6M4GR22_9PROT|nr:type III pantothenate kinase [Usitatibacter rugosus]QJR09582.1 Type III pantothenate kinase [Usitatibacter rugosus]